MRTVLDGTDGLQKLQRLPHYVLLQRGCAVCGDERSGYLVVLGHDRLHLPHVLCRPGIDVGRRSQYRRQARELPVEHESQRVRGVDDVQHLLRVDQRVRVLWPLSYRLRDPLPLHVHHHDIDVLVVSHNLFDLS